MKKIPPYPPRMVGLAAVLACGLFPSAIHAQEVLPVVDDRVEPAGEVTPVVNDDSRRRGGWDLGAVISTAYDDNIFLSSQDAQSDVVVRAGAKIGYGKGDTEEGPGAYVKFAYQPTAVFYQDAKGEDRVDQELALQAGWRGKATALSYQGALRSLGDATADIGRQTDRLEFGNVARIAWSPREKVQLELALGQASLDYEDPTLIDSRKTYAEVAWRYAYSPKTRLGLVYQAGRFEVDGSPNQKTQQVTGSLDWQPREKIRVVLESGVEFRKVGDRSDTNPVLNGRIEWTPREGTSLYATAYQREVASAFFAGQNYRLRGATVGVSQRVGQRWFARLDAGRESATYKQVSGSGAAGREDDIWFVRPSLEYRMNDKTRIECFFQASENQSNSDAFGYEQNLIGVQVNHQF